MARKTSQPTVNPPSGQSKPVDKSEGHAANRRPFSNKALSAGQESLSNLENTLLAFTESSKVSRADLLSINKKLSASNNELQVELLRIQDELRQGQKMETIGRLVGGVAHDFNNMLTAILGFNEMLMENLREGTEAFGHAAEVRLCARRAATLTSQLLAFSHRQVLQPEVISLNTVIAEINHMLRRLVSDDIAFSQAFEPELWSIKADSSQIGQVVLNLTLNARDAMRFGGVLGIRTGNTRVRETGEPLRGLLPGSYVTLTVTDSGTGMDQKTQDHLFEPFFTTKAEGMGTGLGLATVRAIVEEAGGSIRFETELNHGTTFWVDFPRVEGTPVVVAPLYGSSMPRGTETVLVVENESLVRGVVVQLLKKQGYAVLEGRHASEALALCQAHANHIDLLLTDMVLPGGLNGREIAERAVVICPSIRVLMSGCTADQSVHHGVREGAPFLQKPFSLEQLARKVRDVLDNKATGRVR